VRPSRCTAQARRLHTIIFGRPLRLKLQPEFEPALVCWSMAATVFSAGMEPILPAGRPWRRNDQASPTNGSTNTKHAYSRRAKIDRPDLVADCDFRVGPCRQHIRQVSSVLHYLIANGAYVWPLGSARPASNRLRSPRRDDCHRRQLFRYAQRPSLRLSPVLFDPTGSEFHGPNRNRRVVTSPARRLVLAISGALLQIGVCEPLKWRSHLKRL